MPTFVLPFDQIIVHQFFTKDEFDYLTKYYQNEPIYDAIKEKNSTYIEVDKLSDHCGTTFAYTKFE